MRFALFDAPPVEASAAMGFAGNTIDRQSEKRGEEDIARALADPTARLMLMTGGRVLLRQADGAFEAWFTAGEAAAFHPDLAKAVLLGRDPEGPVLAAPADVETDELPSQVKVIDLRAVNAEGLVGPAQLGALAQGAALLAWHASHAFCSRCGAATEMRAGGYRRFCPACKAEHFPRTDPVVIMLAVTPGRCLLGRSPHFRAGMYSALAGFVEPGETIEAAVRREVLEESGIRLGRVVYHASQPWPFPYSLMIGCYGEALTEEVRFDEEELEDCRWFERSEIRAMLAGEGASGLCLPPAAAIAHHLIRDWALGDW